MGFFSKIFGKKKKTKKFVKNEIPTQEEIKDAMVQELLLNWKISKDFTEKEEQKKKIEKDNQLQKNKKKVPSQTKKSRKKSVIKKEEQNKLSNGIKTKSQKVNKLNSVQDYTKKIMHESLKQFEEESIDEIEGKSNFERKFYLKK